MNIEEMREARVLCAVQTLVNPTTMQVATRTGFPTKEVLRHLGTLRSRGAIAAAGRKWYVPSRALPGMDLEEGIRPDLGPTPVPVRDGRGVGVVLGVLALLVIIGLIAVVTWIHGLSQGGLE